MQNKINKDTLGFTLIEILLYIGIFALIVSAIVVFGWNLVLGGVKSATSQEVYSNGRYISERIKQEIRNAKGVSAVTASSITLVHFSAGSDPTIIDISGGNVRIKRGANAYVNLNSSGVTATSLTFTNYTSADNKTKNIKFDMVLQDNNSSSRQEYQSSIMIGSSAEVRSN